MKDIKLDELIRYALAGGIALLAIWLGYKNPTIWLSEKREGALITIAFGALPILIGAVAYILHRALFFPWIYDFLAPRCGRQESTIELDLKRWRHQGKPNALQPKLVEWAAQIHFLYSAAWAVSFANLVAHLGSWEQSPWHMVELSLIPVLFGAALLHHVRYLKWEAAVFRHDSSLPEAGLTLPIWTPRQIQETDRY